MYLGLTYRAHPYLKKEAKIPASLLPFDLIGYANSNYANNLEDKKLIIGYCFFLYGVIIFQYNKKQYIISTPITKAEYIALGYTAYNSIQIRRFFNMVNVTNFIDAYIFYIDNKTSIILTKNAKSQVKTKHIDIQYYYIYKLVADKKITIK